MLLLGERKQIKNSFVTLYFIKSTLSNECFFYAKNLKI